jgi:hypothetical protein
MGSQCSTLIKLELWFIHNHVVMSFQMDGALVGAGSHKPTGRALPFYRLTNPALPSDKQWPGKEMRPVSCS